MKGRFEMGRKLLRFVGSEPDFFNMGVRTAGRGVSSSDKRGVNDLSDKMGQGGE